MNVVIKNENRGIINNLSIDVVKTLDGEFTRDDLERELSLVNYSFVIVDLTSIKNYYDNNYLYDFLGYFNVPNRVILVLNDGFVANSKIFLRNLIEHGYYNFATSDSAVVRLLEKQNSYDDVKEYINGYDFMKSDTIVSGRESESKFETDKTIIGIENGYEHSGATTFMYLLVKELSKSCKVKGIEMYKNDSSFFRDDRVISCNSRAEAEIIIKTLKDVDIFVFDLNGSDVSEICNKVFYLIEPGIIKLNRLIKGNRDIYNRLVGKTIILNRSNVSVDEIKNLEFESKLNILTTVPNLNEREDNGAVMKDVCSKLNISMKKKKSFFNIFK